MYGRPKLKEHMQYFVDHPEEMNKISKVKAQVNEVKGVMMENIEKVNKLLPFPPLRTYIYIYDFTEKVINSKLNPPFLVLFIYICPCIWVALHKLTLFTFFPLLSIGS